jgi:hypothetical protein
MSSNDRQKGSSRVPIERPSLFTIIDDSALSVSAPTTTIQELKAGGTVQEVRDAIGELFNGFIMTKTHQHQSFGIYKASVDSLSGNSQKYIAAIVPNDTKVPVGASVYLKGLPWISFQSRSTDQPLQEFAGFSLKPQMYSSMIAKGSPLYDKIKLAAEFETKHVYVPDHLPLNVEMILRQPDQTFATEAFLVSAINQFQTNVILDV